MDIDTKSAIVLIIILNIVSLIFLYVFFERIRDIVKKTYWFGILVIPILLMTFSTNVRHEKLPITGIARENELPLLIVDVNLDGILKRLEFTGMNASCATTKLNRGERIRVDLNTVYTVKKSNIVRVVSNIQDSYVFRCGDTLLEAEEIKIQS